MAWDVTQHPRHRCHVQDLPDTQTQESEGTNASTRHTRPSMAKAPSDVFEHKGKPYLIVVDYYSKFKMSLMRDKTAGTVVTHMKSIFARHGIPEELISDNMPYNSKEFKQFASDWGFKLTTSSPTYPQANGLSEKAVQTVKRILKKTSDPYILNSSLMKTSPRRLLKSNPQSNLTQLKTNLPPVSNIPSSTYRTVHGKSSHLMYLNTKENRT